MREKNWQNIDKMSNSQLISNLEKCETMKILLKTSKKTSNIPKSNVKNNENPQKDEKVHNYQKSRQMKDKRKQRQKEQDALSKHHILIKDF